MKTNDTQHITVKVHTETAELDEVTRKAERLNELLKEAGSLVDELASREINISVDVK